MTKRRLILLLSGIGILILAAGLSLALGSPPLAARSAAGAVRSGSPVGSGFTYQGWLTGSDGHPISDTCSLDFSLWDADSGGTMIGHQIANDVKVNEGYLAAVLNDGGEFGPQAFIGEARWLKIAVKCSGDGDWSILPGRQLLSPAPYALSLRPGAVISGTLSGAEGLTVVNNAPDGDGIAGYANGGRGVYGSSIDGHGVEGVSVNEVAVYGQSMNTAGYFTSTQSFGVQGITTSDDGEVAAVEGSNLGAGRGIAGYSGDGVGVYGNSTNGHGVEGVSVNEVAVYGQSMNTAGYFTSTLGTGVHGSTVSDNPETAAVEGINLGAGPGIAGTGFNGPGGYFESEGGAAIYAAGDVAQDATAAGLVKAAVFATCGAAPPHVIHRGFNTVAGYVAMAPGTGTGTCQFDFGFDLSQRFWTTMSYNSTNAAMTSCTLNSSGNNELVCRCWDSAGNLVDAEIMVLVY